MTRISRALSRLAIALLLAIAALCQSPQDPQASLPSFEAVSVKPNHSGDSISTERTTPGRLTATNVTIGELLQFAFGIRGFQVLGGPGWLRGDRYDIVATTGSPIDLTDKSLEPYLQSLLTDRSGLKYHRETRELQAYSLGVAKNGPKLTPHTGEAVEQTHEISHGPGKTQLNATNATMANLANLLNRELSRTVIDNTGLNGGYDLRLEWSPDPAPESPEPSLFTALQEQLGLKLESTKGPGEFIVIDHVEKPAGN